MQAQVSSPIDKYDIATEVLASARRVLQAAGFQENEIRRMFQQAADLPMRMPLWIVPKTDKQEPSV